MESLLVEIIIDILCLNKSVSPTLLPVSIISNLSKGMSFGSMLVSFIAILITAE